MPFADSVQLRQHNNHVYSIPYDFDDQVTYSPPPSLSPSPSPIFATPDYTSAPLLPTGPESFDYTGLSEAYPQINRFLTADQYPSSEHDVQHMTNPSHNPPIIVQQSAPDIEPSSFAPSAFSPRLAEHIQHSNPWDQSGNPAHLNPRGGPQQLSARGYRRTHKRLSSSSSIGSTGPDSPYTQTSSYPRIVDLDSSSTSSPRLESFDGAYPAAAHSSKPLFLASIAPNQDPLFAPAFQNYNPSADDEENLAVQVAMRKALADQRGPHLEHEEGSTAESPYPPAYDMLEEQRSRYLADARNVPSLDRTMSNVYEDELYNPLTAPPPPVAQQQDRSNMLSPYTTVFSHRLQAMNHRHMSAGSASPAKSVSRERSPFRQGSEFASEGYSNTASIANSPATRLLDTASSAREEQRAEASTREYQMANPSRDIRPSNTISPKDAVLDYSEAEEAAKMPLFSQQGLQKRENQFASINSNTRHLSRSDVDNSSHFQQNHGNVQSSRRPISSNFSSSTTPVQVEPNVHFMSASLPNNAQMPQQYPFIAISRRQSSSLRSASDPEFPAHLSSMESTKSENSQPEPLSFPLDADTTSHSPSSPGLQRPLETMAATGSYTCTTAGCSQRFDTGSRLHRHRREVHRQTSPLASPGTPILSSNAAAHASGDNSSAAASATNRNNQAGPHRCTQINPSTNKPCNTIFSRSYDLTRHEDTIHNNKKQKIRCHLCTEEKTFSRNDALTRHMRVIHPEVDYPGKTKRRGG